ncbi:hypothetical protein HD599_002583 [Conyzicola lurida]|uniref:Uncharacterized protein n=1 Tax=Conyzicola lurida TaxID=1172621 RepID=A0A841AK20_9MICO|nr:hypothetical protein [Conyzicola lurida]MBB5844260.1 hypothetical protein [Conyzicola lurida]
MTDSARLLVKDRAARLGGGGFLLAVVWLVVSVAVDAPVVRVVAQVLGGVGAPVLTVAAMLLLVVPADGWRRGRRELILCTAAFAFAADLLFVLSFGVGMDEADAGRDLGLFGNTTWLYGAATVVALAALVALLVWTPLGGLAVRRWITVAAASAIGLAAAPLIALSMLSPVTVAVAALAVTVVALARPRRVAAAAAEIPVDWPPVLRRVRTLALASLAYTLAVWAGSIGASVAATGTERATSALGSAMAVGQLAVVPLLLAAVLVAVTRTPAHPTVLWAGFAVGAAGVAAGSALLSGDAFLAGVALVSLAVGVVAAAVVWASTDRRATALRVCLAALALVGVALLYAVFAAMTGGISLALVSGGVALGGAKLVTRLRSPGTLPASA